MTSEAKAITLEVSHYQTMHSRRQAPISVEIASMAKVMKRSIVLAGHKTSISLEDDFWVALTEIAQRERISRSSLVERIDGARDGNLSSAIRTYVLNDFRREAGLPTLPIVENQEVPGVARSAFSSPE